MNILEKFLDILKKPLIELIISNYKELTVAKVDEIADLASANPQSYNGQIFNLARNVNENVVIPIAVIIITFIAIHEIISMVIDKNNMHDFDTFMFFKWVMKTYISIYLVSNSFNFVMSIFEIGQNLVGSVAGGFSGSLDMTETLTALEATLENKTIIELLFMSMSSFMMGISSNVINLVVWIIAVGRIVEIYFVISVSSMPFATLTSNRYSNVGDNYLKTAIALGLQGMFMVLAVAFYSAYLNSIATEVFNGIGSDPFGGMKVLGAGILLIFILLRTKSIANSVVGAS